MILYLFYRIVCHRGNCGPLTAILSAIAPFGSALSSDTSAHLLTWWLNWSTCMFWHFYGWFLHVRMHLVWMFWQLLYVNVMRYLAYVLFVLLNWVCFMFIISYKIVWGRIKTLKSNKQEKSHHITIEFHKFLINKNHLSWRVLGHTFYKIPTRQIESNGSEITHFNTRLIYNHLSLYSSP